MTLQRQCLFSGCGQWTDPRGLANHLRTHGLKGRKFDQLLREAPSRDASAGDSTALGKRLGEIALAIAALQAEAARLGPGHPDVLRSLEAHVADLEQERAELLRQAAPPEPG